MSNFNTLNIGEWSELYAFLKILTDQYLFGIDKNLEYIKNEKLNVFEIKKYQQNTNLEIKYIINKDFIIVNINNNIYNKIPINSIKNEYNNIINYLKNDNNKATFSISFIEKNFLELLCNPKIKSSSHLKSDIFIKIKEPLTLNQSYYGFSIKSNFGNNSTLLNASSGTNFIFNITNNINNSYFHLKTKALLDNIEIDNILFYELESNVFNENLQMIDSNLPKILSYILLFYFKKYGTNLNNLLNILIKFNPLKYTDTNIYKIKVSEFLIAIALGMVPKTKWNKIYEANGGLIVIKNNGDVGTFYIINQILFKNLGDYLLEKTYLDTPSTNRHKFGMLYNENDKTYLKLNLQIRIK